MPVNLGGWKVAAMFKKAMPGPIEDFINSMNNTLKGASYVPVLYVGAQEVHGKNHMILCKQTLAVEGSPLHLVKMVLNENHDGGSEEGQWSLVSIERIV